MDSLGWDKKGMICECCGGRERERERAQNIFAILAIQTIIIIILAHLPLQ